MSRASDHEGLNEAGPVSSPDDKLLRFKRIELASWQFYQELLKSIKDGLTRSTIQQWNVQSDGSDAYNASGKLSDKFCKLTGSKGDDVIVSRTVFHEAYLNAAGSNGHAVVEKGITPDPREVRLIMGSDNDHDAVFVIGHSGEGFDPRVLPDPVCGDGLTRVGGRGAKMIDVLCNNHFTNMRVLLLPVEASEKSYRDIAFIVPRDSRKQD